MKTVHSNEAPAALGPYSLGKISHGFAFISGQTPISAETGAVVGEDAAAQTEQVMKNLSAALKAAGTDFIGVVKTTCFLASMNDFAAFNEVYGRYFTEKPARSCFAVKTLPKNVLVEVEAIAEIES